MEDMYNRYLFVGLGGSGGKTLRFLKDEIRQWLKENGATIPGNCPRGWQFLHIDTPPQPDGDEINDLVPPLGSEEYLGLIRPGVTFQGLQAGLDGVEDGRLDELRTWRVDPGALNIPLLAGAGQFRAVGHTVGLACGAEINRRLEQSLGLLAEDKAQEELGRLYMEVDKTRRTVSAGADRPPLVIVISSLAGGTGAGLLFTVCDLIRAQQNIGGDNLFGILYASEVFQSLSPAMQGGVHANSLAAICELLNGNWSKEGEINDLHLIAAGGARGIKRSGPEFPFIVGSQNDAGVNHGQFDRLFEGTGRALRSWITDEAVQATFIAQTIGNFSQAAVANPMGSILVNDGDAVEVGYPRLSALGFARLSVGTAHFERYAVARLVTDAHLHLTRHHIDSPAAQQIAAHMQAADPKVLAKKLAEAHADDFRQAARIEESGEETCLRNALQPTAEDEAQLRNDCQNEIRRLAPIGHPGESLLPAEWRQRISEELDNQFRILEDEYRKAIGVRAAVWVKEVQDSVVDAVKKAIVDYGLRVAEQLCRQAAEYLRGEVTAHLARDIARFREGENMWIQELETSLPSRRRWGNSKLRSDDPILGECVESALNERCYALDRAVAEEAKELAPQLADRLLTPLARFLDDAASRVSDDENDIHGWIPWNHAGIPAAFGPPTGEFTLIDVEEYQELFDRLLARVDARDGRRTARSATITGSEETDLLEVRDSWSPNRRWQRDGAARYFVASVNSDRNYLKRSAELWLNEPTSSFGRFLGLGLADALDDSHARDNAALSLEESQEYVQRFKAQFPLVIKRAAPLVSIDNNLADKVHPRGPRGTTPHLSYLPFSGHPMRTTAYNIMVAAGIPPGVAKDRFNADKNARHIDVTSALEAPQSVLVIESLLRPIAKDWSPAALERRIPQWWLNRRSRHLSRFIPCPQAHLRCLIRGWFTGRILGLIKIEDSPVPVKIGRPDRDPAKFPSAELSQERDEEGRDRMAVILEALALAHLEVALDQRLSALDAYRQLLVIGKQRPGGGLSNYRQPNPLLARWIDDGRLPAEALTGMTPSYLFQLGASAGPDDRRRELVKYLEKTRSRYKSEYDGHKVEWRREPKSLSEAPLWTGLWPMIGEELDRICDALEAYRQGSDVL